MRITIELDENDYGQYQDLTREIARALKGQVEPTRQAEYQRAKRAKAPDIKKGPAQQDSVDNLADLDEVLSKDPIRYARLVEFTDVNGKRLVISVHGTRAYLDECFELNKAAKPKWVGELFEDGFASYEWAEANKITVSMDESNSWRRV